MNTVVEFAENLFFDDELSMRSEDPSKFLPPASLTPMDRDKQSNTIINKDALPFPGSNSSKMCASRTSLRKGVIRTLLSCPNTHWTLQSLPLVNRKDDESDAVLYPHQKHSTVSSSRSFNTLRDENGYGSSLTSSCIFNSRTSSTMATANATSTQSSASDENEHLDSSSPTNSIQRVVTFHPILEVREYSLAIEATHPPDPPLLLTLDWSYRCRLGALQDRMAASDWSYESFPRHLNYLQRRAVTGLQDSEINSMLQELGYRFTSPMNDSGTLLSTLQKTYQSWLLSHSKERMNKECITRRNWTSLKIT